jgi:hypothetical protein
LCRQPFPLSVRICIASDHRLLCETIDLAIGI